jgi:hypothetical protein
MANRAIEVTNTPIEAKADPFDVAGLRLDPSFIETAGVKKLLMTVPVGRPSPQDFVRVHPDPAFRDSFATIEWKEDRELFIVVPPVARELPGECVLVTLYTAINRQGVVRLWPIRLPGPDGRINEWHRSQAEAAQRAIEHWVRLKSNMSIGAYEAYEASAAIPDPVWPAESFQQLLRIGFRDRLVDRLDHPLIAKLRGRA